MTQESSIQVETPNNPNNRTIHVRSIRGHLIVLTMALMLPLVFFSALLTWYYTYTAQKGFENDAQSYARAMTEVMDNEIHTMIVLLSDGASYHTTKEELAELQNLFSRALRVKDATLIYYDKDNTRLFRIGTLGGDQPSRDRSDDFQSRLSTNEKFFISDLLQDNEGRFYTQISVPIVYNGVESAILSVNISPDYWQSIINRMRGWASGHFGVLDRHARFILTTNEGFQGRVDTGFPKMEKKSLIFQRKSLSNIPIVLAVHKSDFSGWITGIAIPLAVFNIPIQKAYWGLTFSGLSLIALSLLLAFIYGKKISRPIMQLAAVSKALGSVNFPPQVHSSVREVNEVSRLLSKASSDLDASYRALRESEESYRLATDVFQGAVISYDGIKDVSYCSPRFYEMFGQDLEWPKPIREPELTIIHPDDREKVHIYVHKVFNSNSYRQEAEYRIKGLSGDWIWIWDRLAIIRDEVNTPIRVIGALLDITERKIAEEHLELMVNELNHRVKNTLAIVQSIASNTLRSHAPIDDMLRLFESRLVALARAHDLLTKQSWEGANIRDVILLAIAPYNQVGKERFLLSGPDIWIAAQTALSLSMALHEMGTNASKYGALSKNDGRIHISWSLEDKKIDGTLQHIAHMEWREEGGPLVVKPTHKGFGSRLIQRSLANDPNGNVTVDYAQEGIICRFQWTRLDRDRDHGNEVNWHI